MRTSLATVTLATLVAVAAAAHADEPTPRATVALDVFHLSNDPVNESRYSDGAFSVAMLGAELRVADRTWLAASFGAVRSDVFGDHALRPGNPVLGVRTERRRGERALRVGLDVTVPLASVDTVDGDRDSLQLRTLQGAADARGRWNAWAWFPGWMSLVVPARVTPLSGKYRFAVEVAGGVAYDVSGKHAVATTAALFQIAADASWHASPRWRVEGRLALAGMRPGGALERNGAIEVGAVFDHDGVQLRAGIGRPFESPYSDGPTTFLLGATWGTR